MRYRSLRMLKNISTLFIVCALRCRALSFNSSIQRMNDILMMIQFQKVFNNKCEIIFFGQADAREEKRRKATDGSDRTIASFVALNKTLCVCSRKLKLMNDTRQKPPGNVELAAEHQSFFCARMHQEMRFSLPYTVVVILGGPIMHCLVQN